MKTERVLRYLIIGGLFLLPFIPFIVMNSMFFPFITGKNFAFRILIEIVFGLWIVLAARNPIYRPSFSWILAALVSFIAVIALADFFGENPFKSFWSNFERMEGLVGLLHLFALFLVAGTVLNTKKLWVKLANVSIGASVVMGIYGIFQLSGFLTINQGGVRVDGTFGNAAYFAVYMLFHAFITAIFLLKWRGGIAVRLFYAAAFLLQVLMLFYTATRGAILGFVGGMLLAALLVVLFGREYPSIRKGAVVLIIAVLIATGGFVAVRDTAFVEENLVLSRLASISLSEGSARFAVWNIAYQGFKERPILGWGQENFNYVFNEYYDPSLYAGEPWFDRAHNIFFDWLTAGGILGLLAYLSLFIAVLYYLFRRESRVHFSVLETSLITGLLAGYFFHNLFVFDNVMSYILFFALLAFVYSETRPGLREESFAARPIDSGVVNRLVAPLAVVIIGAGVYFFNAPGIATATAMIDALSAADSEKRIEFFEKAASYEGMGSQEVAEQLIQAAIRMAGSETVSLEHKEEIFTLAEREMKEEIERAPNDARLHIFLASLYDQFALHEKARTEILRALELSPPKQHIRYQLAFNYLNRGDQAEALRIFEETYNLEPASDQSRIFYAALLLYNGKDELAEEILAPARVNYEINGLRVIDNATLLQAYIDTGHIEEALEIWEYRVEQNPRDLNARLSLAATLVELGRDTEAIEVIEQIMALEPRFKEQGEYFIEEISAGRGRELIER